MKWRDILLMHYWRKAIVWWLGVPIRQSALTYKEHLVLRSFAGVAKIALMIANTATTDPCFQRYLDNLSSGLLRALQA